MGFGSSGDWRRRSAIHWIFSTNDFGCYPSFIMLRECYETVTGILSPWVKTANIDSYIVYPPQTNEKSYASHYSHNFAHTCLVAYSHIKRIYAQFNKVFRLRTYQVHNGCAERNLTRNLVNFVSSQDSMLALFSQKWVLKKPELMRVWRVIMRKKHQ